MKKSIKPIIILLAGVTLTGLVSCKKEINQGPIDSVYGSEFWTSQSSVEEGAATMYLEYRNNLRASNAYFMNGDYVAGSFVWNQWNYTPLTLSGNWDFPSATINYLGDLTNCSAYYTLLAQCNLMLEQVPAMSVSLFTSPDVKNNYIGEALFMRALTYFTIIRKWGDPLFINHTYDNVNFGDIPPVARTAEATVLDSCVVDLKTAASLMSYTGGDPTKSTRASKGAVYALLAHIYAWQHDYADCHTACQELISNGGYSLEPGSTYANIWAGKTSAESILEIAMTYNANDPNFMSGGTSAEAQFGFFGDFLKDTYDNNYTNTAWIAPPALVDTLYGLSGPDSVDIRCKSMFVQVPAEGADAAGYLLLKYANFQYEDPTNEQYPYVSNNVVLFRLGDILLLDAEAQAMTGSSAGAIAEVNQTRARAGLAPLMPAASQKEVLFQVFQERWKELYGEGSTFYDMIRTQPTLGLLDGSVDLSNNSYSLEYPSNRVASKGYYWPLDLTTLFQQDALLTQNPWWSANK
jgi:hypothetical protein